MGGRRLECQLSPGAPDGKSLASAHEGKQGLSSGGRETKYNLAKDRQSNNIKEAVDISGGTAAYKALFSILGVSFYHQDGSPVGVGKYRPLL